MKGQVWAVTMIRDEVDVAVPNLKHLVTEGVNGFIVADNLSSDGTREQLDIFAKECPVPMIILDDPVIGYHQGRKMTDLARLAASKGAQWIVPFDADELWCGRGDTLANILRHANHPVVAVNTWTHIETGYDLPDTNPFKGLIYRNPNASSLPKVCFRFNPKWQIAHGNDAIIDGVEYVKHTVYDDLEIRHFPMRGVEQFIEKMRRGAHAMLNSPELPESICSHWRAYGRILDRHGADALRMIYFSQFFSAEPFRQGLVKDPAPWCKQR